MTAINNHQASILTRLHSLLFLLLAASTATCTAASQFSNYNAYNYDMTTPQFTPDGRLLQVEYASLAATHSSPCILWRIHDAEETMTLVMAAKSSRKMQQRLIPLSSSSAGRTRTTAVCLSGVLGDSLALVAKVYEMQDEYRRTYGVTRMTPLQVATAIATACQRHSFGGGLRPYGSTICVLSTAFPNTVLQTDPSGAITSVLVDGDGDLHVVGSMHALALRRKLEEEEAPKTMAQALKVAAKHLLSDDDEKENVWLEVMILSKSKGIYKLSEIQVERLVQSVKKEDA